MKDLIRLKIKLLCRTSWNDVVTSLPQESTLIELLRDLCQELKYSGIEVQIIDEFKTDNFVWPLIVNFHSEQEFSPDPTEEYVEQEQNKVHSVFKQALLPEAFQSASIVLMRDLFFGEVLKGQSIVTSIYSWNYKVATSNRTQAMYEHFEMEREWTSFRSVHFNHTLASLCNPLKSCDFLFEGYCACANDIDKLYTHPKLEEMRQHSAGFLDVSTRALAFGHVALIEQIR